MRSASCIATQKACDTHSDCCFPLFRRSPENGLYTAVHPFVGYGAPTDTTARHERLSLNRAHSGETVTHASAYTPLFVARVPAFLSLIIPSIFFHSWSTFIFRFFRFALMSPANLLPYWSAAFGTNSISPEGMPEVQHTQQAENVSRRATILPPLREEIPPLPPRSGNELQHGRCRVMLDRP